MLCCSSRVLLCLLLSNLIGQSLGGQRHFLEEQPPTPPGWIASPETGGQSEILSDGLVAFVLIAVKQRNIESIEEAFWAVSDPTSPKYGQFWDLQRVSEMIECRPSAELIMSWLVQSQGVTATSTFGGEFVHATMPRSVAEDLFAIRLEPYCHDWLSSCRLASTDRYSVPAHLKDHIEFVSGLRLPRVRRPALSPHKRTIAAGAAANASNVAAGVPDVTVIEARDRAFQVSAG